VTRPTDELIAALAADAAPVRRLGPPGLRAAVWLAAALAAAAVAVALFADVPGALRRASAAADQAALAGALLTGVAGVVAAAYLSVPGRPRAWALLPLPPLALWLAASGAGCLRFPGQGSLSESRNCLVFLLIVSLPMAALLFWRLRRGYPLAPRLAGVSGALGVAGLSAALLHFFHPFPVTWLDLGVHLAAITAVLAIAAAASARTLDPIGRPYR
jgi:hypothetical protein